MRTFSSFAEAVKKMLSPAEPELSVGVVAVDAVDSSIGADLAAIA
jgi:hypothetical protein